MSDTNLTNLIVNHLTRKQLHSADFTDHGDELFVQSDHAGVSVGGVGVDALDTTNIANCITEIPQDIKLELNNGTLTLKAGSKVYVPNGAGVFDVFVLPNDISTDFSWAGDVRTVVLTNDKTALVGQNTQTECFSGSTAPSGSQYMLWYDTSNNLLKRTDNFGSTWSSGDSLPICIINGHSSIRQVFNGFGYIGSTIFMLPGVKCLAPNGKNADGSLNNILRTISSVQTMSLQSYMAGRQTALLTINSNGILSGQNIDNRYWGTVSFLSDLANVGLYYSCYYCIEDNKIHYRGVDTVESISTLTFVGSFDVDGNNKITKLNIKQVYHPVDYNDRGFIASQAMPSTDYIDMTLGASGATYIAEASGYVDLTTNMNASGNVGLANTSKHLSSWIQNSYTGYLDLFMPVEKGDTFQIYYTNLSNVRSFRLVILNGAK